MSKVTITALLMTFALLASGTIQAGGHDGSGGGGHRKIGQYSGFEGNEAELGAAVAAAIEEISPTQGAEHNFDGREETLGLAVSAAIKIMNANSGYQHEMNDALVKMTLNFIQFAKDNDLVDEMITEEIATGLPMMTRAESHRENRQRGTGTDRSHGANRLFLSTGTGYSTRTGQHHLQVTIHNGARINDAHGHA